MTSFEVVARALQGLACRMDVFSLSFLRLISSVDLTMSQV